ncbi:uncharacterized protein BP01DRAFT_391390 [Aspergillus saccharolyticus JOP 1030-1]|uniref:DUF6604 domain-containing protein n=1 Tax=Aspergillus saccharolyticus JOP 1030-1 TaxID=1450539 RepID=A0A319AHJ1_9EURO|nr:hypothetical protein BP01DRAFT_391390 [Aspergillus saccharolyticus JOP 1030-1]PYH46062.1 hypothetical protein BP01DRAFT_391390 [Aspergillus saccharolyticus JOP 1030-1]
MKQPTQITQYLQYKQDTQDVATWLLTTDPEFKPKGPGRLKGKARKDAKEGKPSPQGPTEYVLTLKELVERAKRIVAGGQVQEVPALIAIKLRRSIVRRRYQRRYYAQDGDTASNASHEHFVSVLEEMEEILKPILPRNTRKEEQPSSDAAALGNMFEALELEETAPETEEPSSSSSTAATTPTPETPADVICTLEQAAADKPTGLFALEMVMQDLWHMMRFVRESWQQYREGRLSVTAAAIAGMVAQGIHMNSMTELREEEIFIPVDFDAWIGSLLVIRDIRRAAAKGDEADGEDFQGFDRFLTDLSSLPSLIEDFTAHRNVTGDNAATLLAELPKCDWTGDMSSEERHRTLVEEALLQHMVFYLWQKSQAPQDLPVWDILTYETNQLYRSLELSINMVIAAWAHIEVRSALGPEHGKAYAELQAFADSAVPQISELLEGHPVMPEIYRELETGALKFREELRYWTSPDLTQACQLLTALPELSEQLLTYWKVGFYYEGIRWANDFGALVSLVQLYNAAKQEDILPPGWSWPTGQRLMARYPDMFVERRPPRSRRKYEDALRRVYGFPADRGREMRQVWQFTLQVSLLNSLDMFNWTAAEISRVLQESRLCPSLAASMRKRGGEPNLRPVDALERLRQCIEDEVILINDTAWFRYHVGAWKIVHRLYEMMATLSGPDDQRIREWELCLHFRNISYITIDLFHHPRWRELLQQLAQFMQEVFP